MAKKVVVTDTRGPRARSSGGLRMKPSNSVGSPKPAGMGNKTAGDRTLPPTGRFIGPGPKPPVGPGAQFDPGRPAPPIGSQGSKFTHPGGFPGKPTTPPISPGGPRPLPWQPGPSSRGAPGPGRNFFPPLSGPGMPPPGHTGPPVETFATPKPGMATPDFPKPDLGVSTPIAQPTSLPRQGPGGQTGPGVTKGPGYKI